MSVVRLPQVHDPVTQGLITPAIGVYREKGVCTYVGDGLNRWPAAYVVDVARLYRLAIEKAEPNPGLVFPVSAVILDRIDDYRRVLES